jgi:hypothetical protein
MTGLGGSALRAARSGPLFYVAVTVQVVSWPSAAIIFSNSCFVDM